MRQLGFRGRHPAHLALLLSAVCVAGWAAPPPVVHVPNFIQVNKTLYRGGQPTAVGLQELAANGVKRVIDLREPGEATAFEREQLDRLKIHYINIPFKGFSAPTQEQVDSVLKLLRESESTPTFVHCRRGKDRTGTVIACYRIEHDGWDNRRALAEAREDGMSSLERAMQSFILHFTPTRPLLQTAAPLTR